jgi:RluA family pseudouridine synthase
VKFKSSKNQKLLPFLRENVPGTFSVKALKRAIDRKACKINGRLETISTRILNAGDLVEFDVASLEKKSSSCVVLYEDDALFVVDKPSGIVCENAEFQALFPNKKLQLIHRLDKETTGVLLLAKSPEIKEEMIELFQKKEVRKFYLAIVDGKLEKKEGKIESFLVKKRMSQGQSIWGSVKGGRQDQQAVTLWKREAVGKAASLVLCEPITGRTHQIRVHMSEMGHPVLGDLQYGKSFTCHFQPARHLLHALSIRFVHPLTQKEIEIKAPLPEDFIAAQKALNL